MTSKPNITLGMLGSWDHYSTARLAEVLPRIFNDARAHAHLVKSRYWASIRSKRVTSLAVRVASLVLLVLGARLPLIAGVWQQDHIRLLCTQQGVTALALAGLLQAADRSFG